MLDTVEFQVGNAFESVKSLQTRSALARIVTSTRHDIEKRPDAFVILGSAMVLASGSI